MTLTHCCLLEIKIHSVYCLNWLKPKTGCIKIFQYMSKLFTTPTGLHFYSWVQYWEYLEFSRKMACVRLCSHVWCTCFCILALVLHCWPGHGEWAQQAMGTPPDLPCSGLKTECPLLAGITWDNEWCVSLFPWEFLYVFRNIRYKGHLNNPSTGVIQGFQGCFK